ncbi:hypothetical protein ACFQHW_06185 [Lapidilactobacillus achengensis]|uniref:Uncharacterized protein n=1 Tax=Lapidilactobacillus achengensis TaxID=2486000 RepID=A0ABW1UN90_9LACO|nr:hypothetical protein [Lapidilactobacillus achengensis]
MGVARKRNRLGLLLRTGTWWASFEANPQARRLVFKSSLVLSGKAAKDNFTTEPRSPSRLLGRIEPICNRSWVFDEVHLQVSGQTIALFGVVRQCQPIQLIHQNLILVHQIDCTGVANSKLVTTNHGRQLRGFPSIGDSLPVGVSAQTAVITLSGWSGEIRDEIAVSLFLAALPLRIRLSFEIFGVLPKSSK